MKRDLEMEMYDSLDNITLGIKALVAENRRMRAALLDAAAQFEFYYTQHKAKVPPDEAKATTNVQWAEKCRKAALHEEVTSPIT
jgi:Tfp pilus assembly protein PilE